jgi:hypothetical protein
MEAPIMTRFKIYAIPAVALAMVAAAAMLSNVRRAAAQEEDTDESRIQQGFRIAPVPLNLARRNRELVGLGSYLVNTNECADCHSNPWFLPGGSPFLGQREQLNQSGYLAGGRTFAGGTVTARNITPDAQGRPAGYTFDQFALAIRTGADLKSLPPYLPSQSHDLLQVMPWPAFDDWTNHDLRAVYEYLSALPCAEGGPGVPPERCR